MPELVLHPHHQAMLRASGLNTDIVQGRGYRTVAKKAELGTLGFGVNQRSVPALVIPLFSADGQIRGYQARPDSPRVSNGKPIKYETPAGMRMVLDIHPSIRHLLSDPNLSLFVTEGVKKGDSLASRACCAIALLGVWNWRGTNEYGGKTALADWDMVALNGRQVYIVFDSDIMVKREVHQAMARLKPFLEAKKAQVAVVYLPSGESGGKVGVDDFLAAGHTVDDVLALASTELRPVGGEQDHTAPYEATETGLVWHRETQHGPIKTNLTNFVATIVRDVHHDDGAEVSRRFEIAARLQGRDYQFTIPASSFGGMTWVMENLGAEAIVQPGFGLKDHARVAIQTLSRSIPQSRVYAHTGWRQVDGVWVYLSGNGAIGPNGLLSGIEVALNDLAGYALPEPPTGDRLKTAVRASLGVLDVASDHVTVPLEAAAYRAALGGVDFSEFVIGATGEGKTALAALIGQHYGAGMDADHLPANWESTANTLEAQAFIAKDAVLVIDDFAPTPANLQQLHGKADLVLRAQGNRSGRGRMRADTTLRPQKPPRGLIIATGEDMPRGQSLRARNFVVEVGKDEVDFVMLTQCQRDAAAGLYAEALAGFVQWLAPHYEDIRGRLREEMAELRELAQDSKSHHRTPGIVADLALGVGYFLRFACEVGAIFEAEKRALWERCWVALLEVEKQQAGQQAANEPAGHFLRLLQGALASGKAHVADSEGKEPSSPKAWGWREVTVGTGDYQREEWRPQGERIGWVTNDGLYLEPSVAYGVAQSLGRDTQEQLVLTKQTLWKRLFERGLLVSRDSKRNRLTVRHTLQGVRRDVLHLPVGLLLGKVSQLAHSSQERQEDGPAHIDGAEDGTVSWDSPLMEAQKVTRESVPGDRDSVLKDDDGGPRGTVGTAPERGEEVVFRP